MKKIVSFFSVAALFAVVAGCGPKVKTWRPEGSPGYLDLQDKKILVMPLDVRMPGDEVAMQGALLGGIVNALGENALPLQPVQPALEKIGLGNLSWKLAYGMNYAAFTKDGTVWESQDGNDYSMVPDMLSKLNDKAGELLGKPDLKFDYIMVGTIDSLGGGSVPQMAKFRVVGGLYDIDDQKIAVAYDFEKTTAEDALVAEMATLGGKLVRIMEGDLPEDIQKKRQAAGTGDQVEEAEEDTGSAAPAEETSPEDSDAAETTDEAGEEVDAADETSDETDDEETTQNASEGSEEAPAAS